MADRLRLDIEPPQSGWTTVRLVTPDVDLEFVASYTPWDSIGELARATAGLLAGLPGQTVSLNLEPKVYEFRLVTESGRARLEVYQYPDFRRRKRRGQVPIAVVECDTISIARAIWRGLRRLQGAVSAEAFAAAWGHPFPASTVERIGEQLRASG